MEKNAKYELRFRLVLHGWIHWLFFKSRNYIQKEKAAVSILFMKRNGSFLALFIFITENAFLNLTMCM